MFTITKIMEFEAAHCLTGHKGKCKNVHGHSYKLEVTVGSDTLVDGMVMDFGDLKNMMKYVVDEYFDHSFINDWFPGYPTAENMVWWVKEHLSGQLNSCKLVSIRLWETSTSYAEWRA